MSSKEASLRDHIRSRKREPKTEEESDQAYLLNLFQIAYNELTPSFDLRHYSGPTLKTCTREDWPLLLKIQSGIKPKLKKCQELDGVEGVAEFEKRKAARGRSMARKETVSTPPVEKMETDMEEEAGKLDDTINDVAAGESPAKPSEEQDDDELSNVTDGAFSTGSNDEDKSQDEAMEETEAINMSTSSLAKLLEFATPSPPEVYRPPPPKPNTKPDSVRFGSASPDQITPIDASKKYARDATVAEVKAGLQSGKPKAEIEEELQAYMPPLTEGERDFIREEEEKFDALKMQLIQRAYGRRSIHLLLGKSVKELVKDDHAKWRQNPGSAYDRLNYHLSTAEASQEDDEGWLTITE